MRYILLPIILGCSYELPPRPMPGTLADPARTDGAVGEAIKGEHGPEITIEPSADGGAIDSGPETPPTDGPCTPKTSTECSPTERCAYDTSKVGCPTTCVPAGSLGQWTKCTGPLDPACARGHQCGAAPGGFRCQAFCSVDGDCADGFKCVGSGCGAVSWRTCWRSTP